MPKGKGFTAKFGKPNTPIGSCMVSSEGACSVYYKYSNLL